METDIYGPRAAEYFLGAWLPIDHGPGSRPTAAQIRAHIDALGE